MPTSSEIKKNVFQISSGLKSEIYDRALYPWKTCLRKTWGSQQVTNLRNLSSSNDLVAGEMQTVLGCTAGMVLLDAGFKPKAAQLKEVQRKALRIITAVGHGLFSPVTLFPELPSPCHFYFCLCNSSGDNKASFRNHCATRLKNLSGTGRHNKLLHSR